MKSYVLLFLCCIFLIKIHANVVKRSFTRTVHLPFLGLGPYCTGCPQHFCDDDPALIHGYCCGCARFYDILPIKCSPFLLCPFNSYDLCEKYEYMLYCCCSGTS